MNKKESHPVPAVKCCTHRIGKNCKPWSPVEFRQLTGPNYMHYCADCAKIVRTWHVEHPLEKIP